ncbi:hypothetical protein [Streptomyces sp. YS-3]|uniref:hypothetical protein n=1 Tax=Streptomyces sp. YS-3 TaxID=3381352 RepID=UPI0038624DBF
MGSPRTGAPGPQEEPEDDAVTPEPETGAEPSASGEESLREALHRRMRELDDRRAEEPAPGDDKAPADDVEPEEPPD